MQTNQQVALGRIGAAILRSIIRLIESRFDTTIAREKIQQIADAGMDQGKAIRILRLEAQIVSSIFLHCGSRAGCLIKMRDLKIACYQDESANTSLSGF